MTINEDAFSFSPLCQPEKHFSQAVKNIYLALISPMLPLIAVHLLARQEQHDVAQPRV